MFSRRSTRQTLLVLLTAALLLTACNVGAEPVPTQDINALNTAIVGTTVAQLSAQLTQTALAAPTNTATATVTPTTNATSALPTLNTSATVDPAALPTFSFVNTPATGATQAPGLPTSAAPATAPLGDACHNSVFEGDVTIPDGSVIKPGTDFQKVWAIRNTGTCTWDDGYALVQFAGSPGYGPYSYTLQPKNSDFVAAGQGINIGVWMDAPCAPGKYEAHFRMRTDNGFFFGVILSVYFEVKEKCP